MSQLLQQYSASMADKAEELLTWIQMIQQMQEDRIKQHPDEGQQRTDNEYKRCHSGNMGKVDTWIG